MPVEIMLMNKPSGGQVGDGVKFMPVELNIVNKQTGGQVE